MKAEELRIGNWVNYKYWNPEPHNEQYLFQSVEIIGFLKDQFYFNFKGRKEVEKVSDLHPIPLTEDWLLKFGFVSNPYQDRYEKGDIDVECDKTKGETILWLAGAPYIKYIHQLQNLFYALTGEELTIK